MKFYLPVRAIARRQADMFSCLMPVIVKLRQNMFLFCIASIDGSDTDL
jgi:hypothetical protein